MSPQSPTRSCLLKTSPWWPLHHLCAVSPLSSASDLPPVYPANAASLTSYEPRAAAGWGGGGALQKPVTLGEGSSHAETLIHHQIQLPEQM